MRITTRNNLRTIGVLHPALFWILTCLIGLLLSGQERILADEAEAIFDDTEVLTYRLTFSQADWQEQLITNYHDPEQPYIEARFEFNDEVLDPIGVRLKGNSSFKHYPGPKKSFKFKFDEFEDDLRFHGLKKVNLNNCYRDPTMLREKLFYDFANERVASPRANHVRLEINGVYWGLYLQVEQVDKIFFQKHVGDDEDGNLFKGDPHGTLEYLGPEQEAYYNSYELKTNESENDWSDLVNLCDVLNNTPAEDFRAAFDAIFEADNYMQTLAINMLFVHLDSYNGTGHNYYVYHRDDNDKFTHYLWDANETFGTFNFLLPPEEIFALDPHWLPRPVREQRPLCSKLWQVPDWDRAYLRYLARGLRSDFNSAFMDVRIHELADLIRPAVYEDPHKMYTNDEFETNLDYDIPDPKRGFILGLTRFVANRAAYLDARLDQFADTSDLALNELMSVNVSTRADGAGDFDPWLEIYNQGPGRVRVTQVFLTDDPDEPKKWELPRTQIDDGQFRILWLDGETDEGSNHANFLLNPAGGKVFMYRDQGAGVELIDTVTYPALAKDISWGRFADGSGDWQMMDRPTPGNPNDPAGKCLSLDVDNLVAGAVAQFTVADGTPNSQVVVLWSLKNGEFAYENPNWCVRFGIDIPTNQLRSRVVAFGQLDAHGELIEARTIPAGTSGRRVLFQAASGGTCPSTCMSNVFEGIVQ